MRLKHMHVLKFNNYILNGKYYNVNKQDFILTVNYTAYGQYSTLLNQFTVQKIELMGTLIGTRYFKNMSKNSQELIKSILSMTVKLCFTGNATL